MQKMAEIMITKLMPPFYSKERLVERPRLLELLTKAGSYKLILLIAPAGYGKTTLALQYINRLNRPAVWYQLDSYDNDPAVFVQYLVTGIRQYLPDYGRETLQILAQVQGNIGSSLRLVATSLVNGLAEPAAQGLILVLDDYHLIKEPLIDRLLQELLEHLPGGVSVLLASRSAPGLILSRLRVAGELAALGFEELRFNSREIGEYLAHSRQPLSNQQIADLELKTAGWPAALCLLNQSTPEISITLLNRGTAAVYDFLAAEILDRQPEHIKQFLMESSVLEFITAEDCNLLMERNDSAVMIENLLQHQLFLIPLDGEERAYRYHHLFRDFLLNHLNSRKKELYLRAGRMVRSKENWDAAVEYFLNGGDEPELVQTLIIAGRQAFLHGRWQTVQRWLGLLGQDTVKGQPWLSLFQAKVEIKRGRLEAAQSWIEIAVALFLSRGDRDGLAESQLAQARIFFGRGCYQESEDVLEQAGESLGTARFDVTLERALIRFATGKFKESEQLLLQALAFAAHLADDYITANILEALGHANYFLANFPKALEYYQKGAQLCPDRILPGFYMQDFRPDIYQKWGETDQAYEYAERNVAAKEKLGLIDSLPSAYYQMAEILVVREEYDKAEEYYLRAVNLAREHGGDLVFLALNLADLAKCYYLQGNLTQARAAAEEALRESGRQSGLAPAVCKGTVGIIFLETGDPVYAGQLLHESQVALEQMDFQIILHYVYGCLAYLYFKQGDGESFSGFAQKTLAMSASKNFVNFLVCLYQIFAPTLRYGLEYGVEVAFVQKILLRAGEKYLDLLSELAVHSDPQVRLRIIPVLERMKNDKAGALLKMLREDSDPRVKAAAVEKSKELTVFSPGGEPELRIHCLGPLRVFCGTAEMPAGAWRIAKARDLLLYLAHKGEMVNIDRIFEDLWPEISLDKAQSTFYSALYWLRRVLNPGNGRRFVQYHGKCCGLSPECYGTDQQRFENLLTGALGSSGEPEIDQARLEEAVALYCGDYLQDFDYPWALPLREHLKRQFLEASIRLARIWLRQNQYARVITGLHKLAQTNPLHEEIHRLLMSAYAGSGDRLAAGNQYQTLVRRLKKELELAPEPETRELYYKLCGSE